jgi:hypothetical protein
MLYSFWCTNIRQFRDRAQLRLCCLCGSEDGDWTHILSCPRTVATIKRNESWESLKAAQSHYDVLEDIWSAIEHGLHVFNNHQEWENTP